MAIREFKVSLHEGQAQIYNSPARFKVVAAGRRFGKSHFAAIMLGAEAMKTVNEFGYPLTIEHGVYYVAPTFDQARRIMWPKLKELLGYEAQGGLIRRENTNNGWLELISGRRIYIKGADNPDSLRGIALSYLVLDEYADMKSETWFEILEPALMDVKGGALFIGTPKGKNHFYELWMNAAGWPDTESPKGYIRDDWHDWESFHFKSLENPHLDPKEIARMSRASNRPLAVIKQELEASFISQGGTVLKPEWFDVVPHLPDLNDVTGFIYITVDLAGFKKQRKKVERTDETVIATTFVTSENWYILDIQHGRWDTREVALRIMRQVSRHPGCQLGIEDGALMHAIGPYLDDEMRRFNRYVTPVPLKHGGVRKIDRIVGALQGRAERGRVKLVKGDWNEAFLSQAGDFPDPLVHDDILDAVAYVDQMASIVFADAIDYEEWEPIDLDSGY